MMPASVLHHQSMLSCIVVPEQDLLKHSPYKHAKCAKLKSFPRGGGGVENHVWKWTFESFRLAAFI